VLWASQVGDEAGRVLMKQLNILYTVSTADTNVKVKGKVVPLQALSELEGE
jgi:hypothetical protein